MSGYRASVATPNIGVNSETVSMVPLSGTNTFPAKARRARTPPSACIAPSDRSTLPMVRPRAANTDDPIQLSVRQPIQTAADAVAPVSAPTTASTASGSAAMVIATTTLVAT
ncbi:hypothetical protein GCM10022238_45540 [Gordonia hankookensis]